MWIGVGGREAGNNVIPTNSGKRKPVYGSMH